MKLLVRGFLAVICLLLSYDIAEAATYYASPSGSGTTCSSSSPCSLATANTKPVPGDTVVLNGGATYTTAINPTNSGLAGSPITFLGQNTSVTVRSANLSGKSYINLFDLTFYSTSGSWIITSQTTEASTHHINITGCTFNSTDLDGSTTMHSFVGLLMWGHDYTIRNNTFLTWYGGDSIQLNGNNGIVENNDFSKNNSGHGSLLIYGSNIIVRKNYFRNRWDRALEISGRNGQITTNRLIENNIIFDSNWDHSYPYPDGASGGGTSDAGTTQMAKIGGSRTIYRNNLAVATNEGKRGASYAYKGVYEITPYTSSAGGASYWEHLRIYHNTLSDNPWDHGIHMGINHSPYFMDDNVFKNNIINASAGKYSIHMNNTSIPFNTYTFENNILTQPMYKDGTLYTADQLNTTFSTATPDRVKGNSSSTPIFTNPNNANVVQTDPSDNSKISFADFTLTTTPLSPGKSGGAPLTTVTQAGNSVNTIKVDDAYYFFDGYGMEQGDAIYINGQTSVVTGIPDQTTLVLQTPITVASGDPVYLNNYGNSPDIGIVLSASFGGGSGTPLPRCWQ